MILAPSILSCNFGRLADEIEMLNSSVADWLHIDIMDGVFVPNISFGQPIVSHIKTLSRKPLDIHLMIEQPSRYFEDFSKFANILTFHYEAETHIHRSLNRIKQLGMKAGVVLNPHTNILLLEDVICDCDLVMLMSVNPGFGGQQFIENTYNKIENLKNLIERKNSHCLIEIDGGVGLNNYEKLLQKGADILVCGNSIFSASNPMEVISTIKKQR